MNTEQFKDRVANLQQRIYSEGYYTQLWERALKKTDVSKVNIEKRLHNYFELNNALNVFWDLLPDSREIRTGPFFELCDLCTEDLTDE